MKFENCNLGRYIESVKTTRPKLNRIKNTEKYSGEEKTSEPITEICLEYSVDIFVFTRHSVRPRYAHGGVINPVLSTVCEENQKEATASMETRRSSPHQSL